MINYSIDKSDLKGVIQGYHKQFEKGIEIAKNVDLSNLVGRPFSSITVSGMGGSSLPANILRIFLHDYYRCTPEVKRLEIYQNRFYSLPPEAYQNSLNLVCSYSGNTEETLDALGEIVKNGLPVIGISAGGNLEELCKINQIPHAKLVKPFPTFQPRFSTGYFFSCIIQLLISLKLLPDLAPIIKTGAEKLPLEMEYLENFGYSLANRVQNKIILIYSSPKFKSIALAWKIKFNENSKVPAFWNFFPELNHNEIMGFDNYKSDFFVIMLKDLEDHPKNLKRYAIMEQVLSERNIAYEVIDMAGDQIFTKIFRSLLIGEWASYFLALLNKIDPTPVNSIENFKLMIDKEAIQKE